jgi:hypothetical protein
MSTVIFFQTPVDEGGIIVIISQADGGGLCGTDDDSERNSADGMRIIDTYEIHKFGSESELSRRCQHEDTKAHIYSYKWTVENFSSLGCPWKSLC